LKCLALLETSLILSFWRSKADCVRNDSADTSSFVESQSWLKIATKFISLYSKVVSIQYSNTINTVTLSIKYI